MAKYKVMVISIADDEYLYEQVQQADLPANWRSMLAYPELQKLGGNWYQTNRSLVLKVPSAVVPKEYNYVINTRHPDFEKMVSLIRTENYFWDERLI